MQLHGRFFREFRCNCEKPDLRRQCSAHGSRLKFSFLSKNSLNFFAWIYLFSQAQINKQNMSKFFQTINYQYPKPINFDAQNPEFDIFKNRISEVCAAPKITILKNVRISTNSVVFTYFKIFRESVISEENFQKYRKGFRFFLKYFFPKPNFSKKRFLLITDEWTSNYYHWHSHALKRLAALKAENLIENSMLFLPKKYQKYKFVFPSLEKFGIQKNQIVFLPKKSNIKVAELALVECPHRHPTLSQAVRETLIKDVKGGLNLGDKIYISRDGQVLRFVENEKEVVALLEKYGFKKVVMEKLSYEDQVSICHNAKYLISPHGAGLTNLIFLQENACVLEMATDQSKLHNVDFLAIATMLGFNYFYQECEMGESSKAKDFHHSSLLVDLEKLEKNLQLMLGLNKK